MELTDFLQQLTTFKPNSQFIVVHRYRNQYGELSDFNLLFNIDYAKACERSIFILNQIEVKTELERRAKKELLTSFSNSLVKFRTTNPTRLEDPQYSYFLQGQKLIKSVKLHRATGSLHLFGLLRDKQVIEPGRYREICHSQLTLAKLELKKKCPVSNFRQFKLLPGQVERIRIAGMDLLPPNPLSN